MVCSHILGSLREWHQGGEAHCLQRHARGQAHPEWRLQTLREPLHARLVALDEVVERLDLLLKRVEPPQNDHEAHRARDSHGRVKRGAGDNHPPFALSQQLGGGPGRRC